ncbi:hypothetical protein MKX03_014425 [Papaver bracteatum]|nr:hypothetical protein MKX03_014425 [Papaver bracteatum]
MWKSRSFRRSNSRWIRKEEEDEAAARTLEKWSSAHLTYRFRNTYNFSDKVHNQTLRSVVLQDFAK